MPTYLYQCRDCSRTEERYMTIAEMEAGRDRQRCSACEGALVKLFTPVAVTGTDTQIIGTDDGFGNDNRSRQIFRRKCAAAGVPITGKYYPQLCRDGHTLDPEAQASTTGEIKRKLQAMGRGCVEGSTAIRCKVPEQPPEPDRPYTVASDIVEKATRERIRKQGLRLTPSQRKKLRETVRQEITPVT